MDVAPGERLEFADAHSGRVEHEQRQPVRRRKKAVHRQDLLRGWRLRLLASLARELHRETVARRVLLTYAAREVENHRERTDGLADRLAHEAARVHPGDERRDVGGFDRIDVAITEHGEDAPKIHAVRSRRAFGDVHARRLPRGGRLGHASRGLDLRP